MDEMKNSVLFYIGSIGAYSDSSRNFRQDWKLRHEYHKKTLP